MKTLQARRLGVSFRISPLAKFALPSSFIPEYGDSVYSEMRNKKFLLKTVKWGVVLWLFGYILGFILYPFVPAAQLGWFITPIATAVTIWVLVKYIKNETLSDSISTGVIWTIIAVVLDYIFIVMLLKPEDSYYKFDVYLYYVLALTLPTIVFLYKNRCKKTAKYE
jgi:hypothetical protein